MYFTGLRQTSDEDIVWAELLSGKQYGFLMGGSCGAGTRQADEARFEAVGLHSQHAYSVLDVRFVQGTAGLPLRCAASPKCLLDISIYIVSNINCSIRYCSYI